MVTPPAPKAEPITEQKPVEVAKPTPPPVKAEPVVAKKEEPVTQEVSVPVAIVIPAKEEMAEPVVEAEPEVVREETEAIADTPAENIPAHEEEEPQDELSQLKAKFDRVIYSDSKTEATPAPARTVQQNEQPQQKPVVAANTTSIAGKYYTVKKGDTAFSIAKKHNISMRELMEWNELDFNAIQIGQKLRVKP